MENIIRIYANDLVTEILKENKQYNIFNLSKWDSIIQTSYHILNKLCPSIMEQFPLNSSEFQCYIWKYFGSLKPEILLDLSTAEYLRCQNFESINKTHIEQCLDILNGASGYENTKVNSTLKNITDLRSYTCYQREVIESLKRKHLLKIDKGKIVAVNESIALPMLIFLCCICKKSDKREYPKVCVNLQTDVR